MLQAIDFFLFIHSQPNNRREHWRIYCNSFVYGGRIHYKSIVYGGSFTNNRNEHWRIHCNPTDYCGALIFSWIEDLKRIHRLQGPNFDCPEPDGEFPVPGQECTSDYYLCIGNVPFISVKIYWTRDIFKSLLCCKYHTNSSSMKLIFETALPKRYIWSGNLQMLWKFTLFVLWVFMRCATPLYLLLCYWIGRDHYSCYYNFNRRSPCGVLNRGPDNRVDDGTFDRDTDDWFDNILDGGTFNRDTDNWFDNILDGVYTKGETSSTSVAVLLK